ncbi:unnamed protein product [Chilo suppressalis]|uniref:Uncharacterized protein n=1 Tax=Chilo suppressalis TaxID=168631 RepID=A0ABN8BES0_CHISP|nr:unnamed protein product [Chilo suppressalis]
MDVDAPNILKRCSSAPLINEAASTTATSPTTSTAPRNTFFSMLSNNNLSRMRRYSGSSFSPLSAPVNVTQNSWTPRLTPRVNQLRAEECADVSNTREVAHEREVHTAMQMGQSCEDILTLVAGPPQSPTRLHRYTPALLYHVIIVAAARAGGPHRHADGPVLREHPHAGGRPAAVLQQATQQHEREGHTAMQMGQSCEDILTLVAGPPQSSNRLHSPVGRGGLGCKRKGEEGTEPRSKRACHSHAPPTPPTPDSDSLDCTFRPVSPRARPMPDSPHYPTDPKTPDPS